eukprot:CAMPEP_0178438308 /NCGR_PEP_ID=MMETSP0689_2-20121128/35521_1 /TAXON_ID=160604 /ORGANISM="Amphidinium massartii, Strain CS-259" /LENGTH=221 /DNA_ID=CAMNT_0020060697 /DNA_START=55 /DNA_END=717 /DNA_ORIENTATION=+
MQTPSLGNRIYVAGLDGTVNEQDLRNYFEEYGELTDVYIPMNVHTGQKKNFGFITFADEAHAKQVLDSTPHQLKNLTIDIKACLPKRDGGQGKGEGKGKAKFNDAAVTAAPALGQLAGYQLTGAMAGYLPQLQAQQWNLVAQQAMPQMQPDQFAGACPTAAMPTTMTTSLYGDAAALQGLAYGANGYTPAASYGYGLAQMQEAGATLGTDTGLTQADPAAG